MRLGELRILHHLSVFSKKILYAVHNTAVLMHLFYETIDKEYYDIIYKEKLIWTVVKPASMEKATVNKKKRRKAEVEGEKQQ